MNIEKTEIGKEITLKLDGWLDAISAEKFATSLEEISDASAIILDFEKVEYISSAGLRQVVTCARKAKDMNADFSITEVNNEVMNIFSLTGLDKKLNIKTK